MCRLTGAEPPRRPTDRKMDPIDISHLWTQYQRRSQRIYWILADMQELVEYGFRPPTQNTRSNEIDTQLFLSMDPTSIHFQPDSKYRRQQSSDPDRRRIDARGQLDPSMDVTLADVFPISEGEGINERWLAFVSAPYIFQQQYFNATPDALIQRLYYEKLIPDGTGRTYGDLVYIDYEQNRKLVVYTGSNLAGALGPVLSAGPRLEYVVRMGMGVAVQLNQPAVPGLAILHGLVTAIDPSPAPPVISVQLVLVHRNLPCFMNWKLLGATQALQTRLVLQVRPADICGVHRIMPYALYQHPGLPAAHSTPGSFDLVVVGDVDFRTELSDTISILNAWHGDGALSHVQVKVSRVSPLPVKDALHVIARNCSFDGVTGPGINAYLFHIGSALHTWALRKTTAAKNTTADNTLHLRIPGCLFACMLKDFVPWGTGIGMANTVSLEDGVLMVTLPDFQIASKLLQRDSGVFDFTEYGRGFVELFSPIVFKWEMYDTGRSTEESRSVEGFVAITFASYSCRNADNDHEIRGTSDHPHSAAQLRKRPSECPHS